jgi:hypothetical protein
MADATTEFFQALGRRGSEPKLRDVNATVRFDIIDGDRTEHWRLVVEQGDIRVSQDAGDADAVIGVARGIFNSVVGGRANLLAVLLRGELTVTGDPELLVLFAQRLLPGPIEAGEPQPAHAGGR